MLINGIEVTMEMYRLALKRVFDSVGKGKFSSVMREASLIEVVGNHAFTLDDMKQRAQHRQGDVEPGDGAREGKEEIARQEETTPTDTNPRLDARD